MGDDSGFAQMIRRRRNALGLSQARLGELVGRSASTIRKWERGETLPSVRKDALALAAVLGLDETELLVRAGFEIEDESPSETMEQVFASLGRPPADQPAEAAEADQADEDDASRDDGEPGTATSGPIQPSREVPRAAPPVILERAAAGEPSYLEDPLERNWYRRRAVITAAAGVLLLILFLWAWDIALDSLRDLWDEFFSMLQL